MKPLSTYAGYARSLLLKPRLLDYKPFQLDSGFRLNLKNGRLMIGERAHIWPNVKISITGPDESFSLVRIGKHTNIGDRTEIHACGLVAIGENVRISWDVNIVQNPYHATPRGSVVIEDDVWIQPGAFIVGGVRIGAGAVIGPNVVVTKDVPAGARVYLGENRVIMPTGEPPVMTQAMAS